jgi:hypothetical protein
VDRHTELYSQVEEEEHSQAEKPATFREPVVATPDMEVDTPVETHSAHSTEVDLDTLFEGRLTQTTVVVEVGPKKEVQTEGAHYSYSATNPQQHPYSTASGTPSE